MNMGPFELEYSPEGMQVALFVAFLIGLVIIGLQIANRIATSERSHGRSQGRTDLSRRGPSSPDDGGAPERPSSRSAPISSAPSRHESTYVHTRPEPAKAQPEPRTPAAAELWGPQGDVWEEPPRDRTADMFVGVPLRPTGGPLWEEPPPPHVVAPPPPTRPGRDLVEAWRELWDQDVVRVRTMIERMEQVAGVEGVTVLPESSILVVRCQGQFLAVPTQRDYAVNRRYFEPDLPPGSFSVVLDLERPAVVDGSSGSVIYEPGRVRIRQ